MHIDNVCRLVHSLPQPRGDALGWTGPQPRLDPFYPARAAPLRPAAATLHAGSGGPSVDDPPMPALTREKGGGGGGGGGEGGGGVQRSGCNTVVHKTLGIGAGRPWATISVPSRELPPIHQEVSTGPAAQQLAPSYMRPQAAAGAAVPIHPSLPGPLRALGATAPLRQVGGTFAGDDTGAALIPPERAHLDRIARIEARMAKKKRPKSAFAAAAEAAAAAAEAEAAAAAAAAYGQDLVRNQARLHIFL